MHLSRIINPPEDAEESPPASRSSRSSLSPAGAPPPIASPAPTTSTGVDEDLDEELPAVSFMVCMEASEEGKVTYLSPTALDLLGWDPDEVIGTPAARYCHPDDVADLYRAYQEMIDDDKAACLMYHRIPYKDPGRGYVLCSVTISRVGPHLIGACTPATSEMRAMHNASTASEVFVITPSASRLAFRRWSVPKTSDLPIPSSSPVHSTSSREVTPPTDTGSSPSPEASPKNEADELVQSFNRLTLRPPSKPEVAKRAAFVLNRFSVDVPVLYLTNDEILPRSVALGRSFYDFVTSGDEIRIRQAMDAVKAWGVNERGSPADGGFAFNRFHMYLRGRDSSKRPEGEGSRKRRSVHTMAPISAADLPDSSSRRNRPKKRTSERGINVPTKDVLLVDCIFSPQSDGIIVIVRPALQTGVKS